MRAAIILIVILAATSPRIYADPTIDQKYNFLITEYKILQSITNTLHREIDTGARIYSNRIELINISNQAARVDLGIRVKRRTGAIILIGEIAVITAFVSGFVAGIKGRN